jgi:hypothetical protein
VKIYKKLPSRYEQFFVDGKMKGSWDGWSERETFLIIVSIKKQRNSVF